MIGGKFNGFGKKGIQGSLVDEYKPRIIWHIRQVVFVPAWHKQPKPNVFILDALMCWIVVLFPIDSQAFLLSPHVNELNILCFVLADKGTTIYCSPMSLTFARVQYKIIKNPHCSKLNVINNQFFLGSLHTIGRLSLKDETI